MKGKGNAFITLIALLLFVFMTVGYGMYEAQVTASGQANFAKNGVARITSVILTDYKNLNNPANPTVNGNSFSVNLNFTVARSQEALSDDYYAEYTVNFLNDTFYDYVFNTADFTPSIATENNENMEVVYDLNGISQGDVIPSKESTSFTFRITMIPNNIGNFNVSGEATIDIEEDTNSGSLLGSIPKNSTGDLKNNTRVAVTATIMNTYSTSKEYNIVLNANNFELVDENGNPLTTYTIDAFGETEETFYIKLADGARFASETQSINVYLQPVGEAQFSMGIITLTVPKDGTLVDVTPPTIDNVTAEFQANKGNVKVSYHGEDDIQIDHYEISTYKVANGEATLYSTDTATGDSTSHTVSGLEDGIYYFTVKVFDTAGFSAEASSSQDDYRWTMNVTINITQGGPNGTYTVDYGNEYTTTITANNNRNRPTRLTVTMGGETLTTSDYTYSYNTGSFRIASVTGDLSITGATSSQNVCLIKGTKIRLANNQVKNIEDVQYDDLLLVWSYELGRPVEEYPLWIEKGKQTNEYIKITFSDNSTINIHNDHAFFSADENKFINFKDKEHFHIGTNIKKLDNDKLITVQVKNIETIEEDTSYYFVASTRYYNIISDDFITTDMYTDITNLYPFNDNITWSNDRIVQTIDYEYLQDVLPYYMYKGFRAGEVAILLNNNLTTIPLFKDYISNMVMADDMLLPPILKNNERYWMVTTDNDTVFKKEDYLVKEGDIYTLPMTPNGERWYSTSENTYYKPGDKVQVWTGMHFIKTK